MSLEEAIRENTAAVEKLIAKLDGGAVSGGAAAAGAKKADAPKKADAKKAASKYTPAQVQAAITEVKEKFGTDEAKAIIEEAIGSGGKLAALVQQPDKFDAVMAACEAKMSEDDNAEDGGDL